VTARTELSDLLRAMARRDWGRVDQLIDQLDKAGWHGKTAVIGAAFAIAVNRRFGGSYTPDDIARFVAETRSQFQGADAVPALAMEGLTRAALGEVDLADGISPTTAFEVQLLIIGKLLQDANFTEAHLETFIAEVEQTAAEYL
jgi:hypothetical protein